MADNTVYYNKPVWSEANAVTIGDMKCGCKTFNINDDNQLLNCANEIVCRKYLTDRGFKAGSVVTYREGKE